MSWPTWPLPVNVPIYLPDALQEEELPPRPKATQLSKQVKSM
jgi:hypothetical protein